MTVAKQLWDQQMTLNEYRTLPTNERLEIIDGYIYDLAAPSSAHQFVSGEIFRQLANYLHGKSCHAYTAPFDVYLDEKTVVQPDITLICDPDKRKKDGCHGAPDMVVEILSPSSAIHDLNIKKELYRKHGVREYWVVHPDYKLVQTFLLQNDAYISSATYVHPSKAKVNVLDDCEIDLESVFAFEEEDE